MAGNIIYACLDPGGFPQTVTALTSSTGVTKSIIFSILSKQAGVRNLWLQLGPTAGSLSAFVVDLQQSFDGGTTWGILQSGIDLFNSPSQQISPPPSPGAILRINVDTVTAGSGSVVASSN